MANESELVNLNIGGKFFTTTKQTLVSETNSLFTDLFVTKVIPSIKDSNERIFLDRDGSLFTFILEYLRSKKLSISDDFTDKSRLKCEAEYYKLPNLVKLIDETYLIAKAKGMMPLANRSIIKTINSGYITISFRGKFSTSHNENHSSDFSDIRFRKISRIMCCGRVKLLREVFGETLNESRDPDHGESDRYTTRFFLKHFYLEQAYDTLAESNFHLVSSNSIGANWLNEKELLDNDENRWLHFTELIFRRI